MISYFYSDAELNKQLEEQKIEFKRLEEKVETLSISSKKYENDINTIAEELMKELTNRSEQLDTLRALVDYLQGEYNSSIPNIQANVYQLQNKIGKLEAKSNNDMEYRLNRLENHARKHWGYMF